VRDNHKKRKAENEQNLVGFVGNEASDRTSTSNTQKNALENNIKGRIQDINRPRGNNTYRRALARGILTRISILKRNMRTRKPPSTKGIPLKLMKAQRERAKFKL
jgi:hypothetical protein